MYSRLKRTIEYTVLGYIVYGSVYTVKLLGPTRNRFHLTTDCTRYLIIIIYY